MIYNKFLNDANNDLKELSLQRIFVPLIFSVDQCVDQWIFRIASLTCTCNSYQPQLMHQKPVSVHCWETPWHNFGKTRTITSRNQLTIGIDMIRMKVFFTFIRVFSAVELNGEKCGVNDNLDNPRYIVGGNKAAGPGRWPWACSLDSWRDLIGSTDVVEVS